MPAPVIIGAVAAGSAVYGLFKGAKGAADKSDANDINARASSMVDNANKSVKK